MLIKTITLVLMAIFYICYFTKMIRQKKQGIETDQLGKDKEGFIKLIEIALKLMTYLTPMIQVLSILSSKTEKCTTLHVAGITVTAFGVTAFILSVMQMKDNWRAGVQRKDYTNLVTDGIYSISRNPAFLGFDLMYIGILMTFFNWYLCLASVIAVILFHLQIVNVEEDFLIERFGDEYIAYRKKVCRYLGRK